MKAKPTYNELESRIKELESDLDKFRNKQYKLQVENELKNAERKSRAWLENSPVCTKIVDLDFNLRFMSSSGIEGLKIKDINEHYGHPYPFHFYPDSFKIPMNNNLK